MVDSRVWSDLARDCVAKGIPIPENASRDDLLKLLGVKERKPRAKVGAKRVR